jgi:photosystem II stability/assembly factor-like uncharacterized protein
MTSCVYSKLKLIWYVILALLLLTSHASTGDRIWTGHGPFFVQVGSIQVSPANGKLLYATGGRLMRSIDGGLTWRQLVTPHGPLTVVKPHPKNGKIVFAAIGSSFFISRDQGTSWEELGHSVFDGSLLDLEIDPNNPNTIYGARYGYSIMRYRGTPAILRSTDGGRTWLTILAPDCCDTSESSTAQIEFEPRNPNILYAAFDQHFFSTSDQGKTWKELPSNFYIHELRAVGKTVLYAGSSSGVWKSINGGNEWFFTGERCGPYISVDRMNPKIVYATGSTDQSASHCTQKTTDGGSTWQDLKVPHPWNVKSVNLIVVNPKNSKEVYASSDLFYRSINGGRNWRTIVNGKASGWSGCAFLTFDNANPPRLFANKDNLNTPVDFTFLDLAIHTADPNFMVGAGETKPGKPMPEKTLVLSFDGGKTWHYATTPFTVAQAVVLNPTNPNIIHIAGQCPAENTICVANSADRGKTWQLSNTTGTGSNTGLWSHPTDPSTLYVTTETGPYRSNDGGRTWKLKSQGIGKEDFISLSVGPKYIYAAGYRSNSYKRIIHGTDLTMSKWIPLIDVSDLVGTGTATVLAHPTEPEIVFVGGFNGILISKDAGTTWSTVTTAGLMNRNFACDLAITPFHPDTLFGAFISGVMWLQMQ